MWSTAAGPHDRDGTLRTRPAAFRSGCDPISSGPDNWLVGKAMPAKYAAGQEQDFLGRRDLRAAGKAGAGAAGESAGGMVAVEAIGVSKIFGQNEDRVVALDKV